MRPLIALVAAVLMLAAPLHAQQAPDPLAEARRLYNLGNYEAAELAARQAASQPALADAARLVLGRIQLERYRRSGDTAQLGDARGALLSVDARALSPRERLELSLGFAEAVFLEDRFGAAAELFEPLIDASALLGTSAHTRALDWWATALDRHAQQRPDSERAVLYGRILDRMADELASDPGSTPASYWLAAASRGRGDLERAWQAAIAGWLRAPLTPDRGAALRADLDRLMVQGIIPARAVGLGIKDTAQARDGMLAEWEAFKARWTRAPR